MRIRSIKPEYWQHEMHGEISLEASLLGAALYNFADDEARFKVQFVAMRSLLFTCRQIEESAVEKAFGELVKVGHVLTYKARVDGRTMLLGKIRNFNQAINKPQKSDLPAPPPERSRDPENTPETPTPERSGNAPVVLPERSGNAPVVLPERSRDPENTPETPTPERSGMTTGGRKEGEEVQEGGTRAGARADALSLSPQFSEPSLQDVLTYADMHAIPEDCATKWFWDRKGDGWIYKGTPIANWPAKLQAYAVSWRGNEFVKNTGDHGNEGSDGKVQQLEAELAAETDPAARKKLREELKKLT